MPVNRNALIRYKTLDKCLRNRFRKWTLDDLIDEVSEALYEYEGIDKGVSRRTVQADIQMMRSDKLGYNAPIIVENRKHYTYEDPNYSITNIPLSEQDLGMLGEAVEFMKQFQGFSYFQELDGMVQKLEDHIYAQRTDSKPVIDFEKNENLKGLNFLDQLYRAIIAREALQITYQSFKARQPNSFVFYPYLLKEFRNRWFLIGMRKDAKKGDLLNLALDRLIAVEKAKASFRGKPDFDAASFYRDVIGVSVSPSAKAEHVELFFNHKHAPYVATKPLHHSQREIGRDHHGVTFALDVQLNFELEKEILAFGEVCKVLKPERLRRKVRLRLEDAVEAYQTELSRKGLTAVKLQLEHRGTALLNKVYTGRELRKIGMRIDKLLKGVKSRKTAAPFALRKLFLVDPDLASLVLNDNLREIVRNIDKDAFLVKALLLDKSPQANWYVSWHQDVPINVAARKAVKGYTAWTERDGVISVKPPLEISQRIFSIRVHLNDTTAENGALKVVPGSHKKVHSAADIQLITENSQPLTCEIGAGGIHLLHPLILHASSRSKTQRKRRVIHLEFCSRRLDAGLEWLERLEVSMP